MREICLFSRAMVRIPQTHSPIEVIVTRYTDKKEERTFLKYREIQSGAVAKSYIRNGFLKYDEMQKYFPIYEEAVSHI
jgi:hypothetical protein